MISPISSSLMPMHIALSNWDYLDLKQLRENVHIPLEASHILLLSHWLSKDGKVHNMKWIKLCVGIASLCELAITVSSLYVLTMCSTALMMRKSLRKTYLRHHEVESPTPRLTSVGKASSRVFWNVLFEKIDFVTIHSLQDAKKCVTKPYYGFAKARGPNNI